MWLPTILLGRLLKAVTLLLAASALCFLLGELAPGDPWAHLRLDPAVPAETLEALRARYRLDQPLIERYLAWLWAALHGDLGYSLTYHRPVSELVAGRAGTTLGLTLLSAVAGCCLALGAALALATRRFGWGDRLANALAAGLQAIPPPVLALAVLAIAAPLGMLPLGTADPAGAAPSSHFFARLVLPGIALTLSTTPFLFRQARTALAEALAAPAILAARARGLGPLRLVGVHVLKLAAKPLIGLAALSFAGLLGGSVVVEVIFGLPGLGPLMLEAVLARDVYLVSGCVLWATVWLQGVWVVADLLVPALDPRAREGRP